MKWLEMRVTLVDRGEEVDVWFHLEEGPPDTLGESFIAGTYESVPKAEEALAQVIGVRITRMPNVVR